MYIMARLQLRVPVTVYAVILRLKICEKKLNRIIIEQTSTVRAGLKSLFTPTFIGGRF